MSVPSLAPHFSISLPASNASHLSFTRVLISTCGNPKPSVFPEIHFCRQPSKSVSLHSVIFATATKAPGFSVSQEPVNQSDAPIKMPTAPWQKGPRLLQPNDVCDLSKPRKKKKPGSAGSVNVDKSLTEKIRGVRGPKAMKKIVRSVENLGKNHNLERSGESTGGLELGFSLKSVGRDDKSKITEEVPWWRPERVIIPREKKARMVTASELSLDAGLLKRLRNEADEMRKWVKVKKSGLTQDVLHEVNLIWRNNELVMLKFDVPLCMNMSRAREIVETKTRGLVVWSKRDFLVVYRGCNYLPNSVSSVILLPDMSRDDGREEENACLQPMSKSLYEREADRLLDGLGPRFIDWWLPKPLPVDADLLPEVVSGFRVPSRICPRNARAKLADNELTKLRKLSRPLPTHFVLGRNKNLQGLAAAILKLWEKCHIVKIAVKWGIPNTSNELMAHELKNLTGGVLLLRNKFYIIIYRGKDFIPRSVAKVIADREIELETRQLNEEAARPEAHGSYCAIDELMASEHTSGTLSEFQNLNREHGNLRNENWEVQVQLETEKERLKNELRRQEHKLSILKMKIGRSTKVLLKLNSACWPLEQALDLEMITDEERECFRKIGLKMHGCLVLGRRGVFDGVIEGLHQHWKYREVVKVITKQKQFAQVVLTALSLEAESGGILVSIETLRVGHAMIIYRGKNYRRPVKLIRGNLLTKRSAMHRSVELQRFGSLKFFAYQRQRSVSGLRSKLAALQQNENGGSL